MRKKERRQFESSVVSLMEEKRDINTLQRVALVEKESDRLMGYTEQKRVPLLQFAERGLHKVGFSFMMASQQTELLTDSSSISNASSKSNGSNYEEEVVSLELEKTEVALEISNTKLKLKEELANAAMAAQTATENSLQLAGSRAAGLLERIEELTRQL